MSRFGGVPVDDETPVADEVPIGSRFSAAEPQTTAGGLLGGLVRGAGPTATGAAVGAVLGAPAAGIGAIPGAAIGAAVPTLATFVGDPVIEGINAMLGTKYETPTQSIQALFDRLGVPQAKTEAERVVQTAAQAGSGAAGSAALARQIAQVAPAMSTLGASAQQMAAQPAQQIVGGAAAGGASQATAEAGGGPVEQLLAALAGGLVGVVAAPRAIERPSVMVPQVKPQPPEAPPAIRGDLPEIPAASAVDSESFGTLVRTAVRGDSSAREQVAKLASINPEAKAAAERLGLELPADVLTDHRLLQETTAMARGVKGSPQSVAWAELVTKTRNRADEVMTKLDASPDMSIVSSGIQDDLARTRDDLEKAARIIYKGIDDQLPKSTPVNMEKTQQVLSDTLRDLGGMEKLTVDEKRLLSMATDPNTTYGALLREKSSIGEKLAGKGEGYPNLDKATLSKLYGALSDDQIDTVGASLGEEYVANLREANKLTAQRKVMERRIVGAFGKEGEGSIAAKLQAAVRSGGSKGDVASLHKALKVVPKGLQKEALSSAIFAQSRTPEDRFSFTKFANLYQGIRKNSQVYAPIHEALGDDGAELMRSLYVVSRRMSNAEQMIDKTGKANQALFNSLIAEGITARIVGSPLGRAAATAAAVKTGVPIGGAIASSATEAIASRDNKALEATAKFLTSKEFESLIINAAKKGAGDAITERSIRNTARSAVFNKYASAKGIAKNPVERERWLRNVVSSSAQQSTTEPENGR